MTKCPSCHAELSDEQTQSGQCPACQAALTPAPSGSPADASSSDIGSTMPDDVIQTIAEGLDLEGADETGTVNDSDIGQTIDETAMPPQLAQSAGSQHDEEDEHGTVDSNIGKTVDESALPSMSFDEDAMSEAAPTEEPAGIQQTIDEEMMAEGPAGAMQTIADDAFPPADDEQDAAEDDPNATVTDINIGGTVDESAFGAVPPSEPELDAAAPSDAMRTIDESDMAAAAGGGMQTIDESSMPGAASGDPMRTIDESDMGDAGTGDPMRTIDESAMGGGMQTIDESAMPAAQDGDLMRTIDESDMAGADSADPMRTIDESAMAGGAPGDGMQTIDESAMAGQQDADGKGTVADIGATVDLSGDAPQKDPGTVHERGVVQTVDGELAPDVAQRVGATWSGSVDPGATAGTSLKADMDPATEGDSSLVIQQRGFRKPEERDVSADYDLLDLLGEGGMGMVYAARQASIDRTVAIKMLKPKSSSDQNQRNKFLAEAAVTGELEHPNIVPIYDLGRNPQGALFYAMKRVQGTPWDECIAEKSLHENLETLMKVADAIGFAHSRGILHRDLKPENTMLGGFGEVLVMDWGLAIPTDKRRIAGLAPSGSMGGTPAYMAPEMAAGPFNRIGIHSDIYLLGAMLYEIVTGRPPHTGKDVMKCLFAAAKNDIVKTDKSGELVDIALTAMATKPEDRYATASDLQDAIRGYLEHSESIVLSAHAQTDLAKARESSDYQDYAKAMFGFQQAWELWDGNKTAKSGLSETRIAYAENAKAKGDFDLGASLLDENVPEHGELLGEIRLAKTEVEARQHRLKRMRRVMQAGVAIFLFVVVGFSGWVWIERAKAFAARDDAEIARNDAVEARDFAKDEEQKAKDAAKAEEEAKNEALLAKKEAEDAAKAEEKAKDEALAAKQEADAAKDTALAAKTEADIAKDAALAAAEAEEKAKNAALDAKAETEFALIKAEVALGEAEVSQQHAQLAKVVATLQEMIAAEAALAAKRAKEEAVVAKDEAVVAKNEAVVARNDAVVAKNQAIDAKNEAVAQRERAEYEAYVNGINAAAGEIKANAFDQARATLGKLRPKKGAADFRGWEWYRLWKLCNLSANYAPEVADGTDLHAIECVAYHPDGKRFVAGDESGKVRIWTIKKQDEKAGERKPPIVLDTGGSRVFAVAISQDGKLIATGSNDRAGYIRFWDANSGKQLGEPIAPAAGEGPSPALSLAFSQNGRRLLAGCHDARARIWDVETGELLGSYWGHSLPVTHAAFSPVKEGADENSIVTVSEDGQALVWLLDKDEVKEPFLGHNGRPIYAAAFAPDGEWVATAGADKRVMIWRIDDLESFDFQKAGKDFVRRVIDGEQTPQEVPRNSTETLVGHQASVRSLEFSDDGLYLVSASHDNTVIVWDVAAKTSIKTLRGHGEWVRCAAFSPNANWVVSGSKDGSVKRWNLGSYSEQRVLEVRTLDGHTDSVLAAKFSHDGKQLVTGSRDRTGRGWSVVPTPQEEEGVAEELFQLREGHQFLATNGVFFDDGNKLATAALDNSVRIWDVRSQRQLMTLPGTGRSAAIAVSADNSLILTGGPENLAILWDAHTGEKLETLDAHMSPVSVVAISPDNRWLITGDAKGSGRLWDAQTREVVGNRFTHVSRITAAVFVRDANRFFTASTDTQCVEWTINASGGDVKLERSLVLNHRPFAHDEGVHDVAVSPDGNLILTCAGDGVVRLWNTSDVSQPIPLKTKREAETTTADSRSERGKIKSIAFSPDGKLALAVNRRDRIVHVFNVSSSTHEEQEFLVSGETFGPYLQFAEGRSLWGAKFSPDGQQVLTIGGDEATLWSLKAGVPQTNRYVKTFSPHGIVTSISYSSDNRRVATVGQDGSVRIWDLTSEGFDKPNETTIVVQRHADNQSADLHWETVNTAVFSPDNKFILTASEDGTAQLFDVATHAVTKTFGNKSDEQRNDGVMSAVFSPDGRRVLTVSRDKKARIWSVDDDKSPPRVLVGHSDVVLSGAFSKDGNWVMTGSRDNEARIWDASTGKSFPPLGGHTAAVTSVAFSPDLKCVVTGSQDFTAKVWDCTKLAPVKDGKKPVLDLETVIAKEVLTLRGHTQEVTTVDFSADGQHIVTGGHDGRAIIWMAAPRDDPKLAPADGTASTD